MMADKEDERSTEVAICSDETEVIKTRGNILTVKTIEEDEPVYVFTKNGVNAHGYTVK